MPPMLNPGGTLGRALGAMLPSALRRYLKRAALRRRYGLASLGPDFESYIGPGTLFGIGCRLGGPVYISGSSIGDYTYIETGCRVSAASIGAYCSIAPYTLIGLAEHPSRRFASTHPIFYRHLPAFGYDLVPADTHREIVPTAVGNDVWIGAGACIRGGVRIGDGAIVGAGAVVTGNVEPYAVYAGVPARLIRYRFDDDTIDFLLRLKWWDRGLEWLRQHAVHFQDVDALRRVLDGPAAAAERAPGRAEGSSP